MKDESRFVTPDAPRTLSDKPFPRDPRAPTLASLRGSAPSLTRGLSSERYIRMQRDLTPERIAVWTKWVTEREADLIPGCYYSHSVTLEEMKAILSLIEFSGAAT